MLSNRNKSKEDKAGIFIIKVIESALNGFNHYNDFFRLGIHMSGEEREPKMEKKVQHYYKLKAKHKEIEKELAELRQEIVAYCAAQGETDTVIGSYRVKLVTQNRKEYDDEKLYNTLADPQVWRLMSKVDPAKVASLAKLKVIAEDKLADTYTVKEVTLLTVDKQ